MKKPYQIESQRAVRRLEEMAAEGNPAVQMVLPMAEMVGWLRNDSGHSTGGDRERDRGGRVTGRPDRARARFQ
jgi:hypothetical protein